MRLVDENDQMIGIVDIMEAKRRAKEAGLDLVEVSPDTDPPVCKIRDFGKWKYEQSKKDKAARAKTKAAELKEVRLGRSMKIDPHDIEIRLNQARRFLMDGHKVQIVQNFRGREMVHRERGNERMRDIIDKLADISKVETPPRMAGRRMTMILAPEKAKIEQLKRQQPEKIPPPADPEETPEPEVDAPVEAPEDQPEASTENSPAPQPQTVSRDTAEVSTSTPSDQV